MTDMFHAVPGVVVGLLLIDDGRYPDGGLVISR